MNARDTAVMRAADITAPEDAAVRELCEAVGYGAVMDAAARLWAQKDPMGALFVADECLNCKDLAAERDRLRGEILDEMLRDDVANGLL